jgi:pimeloyl-ACP methyl ester carboxylesterase
MTTDARDAASSVQDFASVNGLKMYYEMHGSGRPLLLLHGGLHTIGLTFGPVLPALATTRRVIAVEMQGHGRTADIDREPALEHLAGDIAALLDHLGLDRADVFGFSLGGLVALQLATARPERVDRLVLAATHYRPDGYHDEILDPDKHATSTRMPTEADFREMYDAYVSVAPDPAAFQALEGRFSAMVGALPGWPADALRKITAPVLLIVGDHDFVRLDHAIEMHDLIPDSRLTVLPGTTHAGLMRRDDLIVPMVESFLSRPA